EDVEQCQALLAAEQIPRHVGAETVAGVIPGVARGGLDHEQHADDGKAQGRRPEKECRWHGLSELWGCVYCLGLWSVRSGTMGTVAKDTLQKCDLPPGTGNVAASPGARLAVVEG